MLKAIPITTVGSFNIAYCTGGEWNECAKTKKIHSKKWIFSLGHADRPRHGPLYCYTVVEANSSKSLRLRLLTQDRG